MNIREMQNYTSDILKNIAGIFEKEGITYTGIFGTMLATVRHAGPIPWDYDVDLGVPFSIYRKAVSVLEKELPEKYWVVFRNENETHRPIARVGLRGYRTNSLHVDIFPIIGVPEDAEKQKKLFRKIRRAVSMRCAKEYEYTGTKGLKAKLIKYGLFFITSDALCRRFDKLCGTYPYDESKYVGMGILPANGRRKFEKVMIEDTYLADYDGFKIRIPKAYDTILTMIYKKYMEFPPEEKRNRSLNKDYKIEKL